jgi:hypothetical protein
MKFLAMKRKATGAYGGHIKLQCALTNAFLFTLLYIILLGLHQTNLIKKFLVH